MMKTLDFTLLGREFSMNCAAEDEQTMTTAAKMLDSQLRQAQKKTQLSGEKLFAMVALNIAHDLVRERSGKGIDEQDCVTEISAINERLRQAIDQQDSLF